MRLPGYLPDPDGERSECQGRFWHEGRLPGGSAVLVGDGVEPDGTARFSGGLQGPGALKSPEDRATGVGGPAVPSVAGRKRAPCYLDNSPTLDTPPGRGPVKACRPTWIVLGCGCGVRRVENRCGAEDCEPCAEGKAKGYTARRRGKRLAPRVWGNLAGEAGPRALLHTTFTVPTKLRARAWSRKWWESRVLALRRQLRERWGLDWALASYHPTGDKGQGREFKPHLHVLWTRRAGGGFLPSDALRMLRWTWGRILESDRLPVVNHNYVRPDDPAREPKVWHRVQYITRPFPGWSSWRGQSSRWWGHPKARPVICPHCQADMPDGERPDDEICPECGCHMGPCCEKCGEPLRFLTAMTEADVAVAAIARELGHKPRRGSTWCGHA